MPAFPFASQDLDACGMPRHEMHINYGMTLRDYFAAKLAPEILRQFYEDGTQVKHSDWRQGVAVEAYRIADEMLDFRGQ